MTTDVDHEEAIRRQMLENFSPVGPADAGSQSNELMEQVIISNSSAEGFGHIVLKQWRSDSRASPPRDVWAVLGSDLEAYLLTSDLTDGCVSDSATEPVPPGILSAGGVNYRPGTGQIFITTFGQLGTLLRAPEQEHLIPPHLTVMMNFGFGRVTFDMAFTSTCLMKRIKHEITENKGRIAACTVANSQAQFFGPGWPSRRIQELDMCQDKDGRQVLKPVATDYVWYDDVDKHNAKVRLLDTEARLRDADGTKRVAIIINEFDAPPELLLSQAPLFCTDSTSLEPLRQIKKGPLGPARQLLISSEVPYCGPVGELGHIIVNPLVTDWVFDKKIGHMVISESITSKAEVHHAARLRGNSGAAVDVHCLMSRRDYQKLPLLAPNSPAHSVDLPRLLLACTYTCDQAEMPFRELPVSLPGDEYVVEEQLRRLCLKGLITCRDAQNGIWRRANRKDHYEFLIKWLIVERPHKAPSRVEDQTLGFVVLVLDYSRKYCNGEMPQQVNFRWPYTKAEARRYESTLKRYDELGPDQMPQGMLDGKSMTEIGAMRDRGEILCRFTTQMIRRPQTQSLLSRPRATIKSHVAEAQPYRNQAAQA